MDSDFNKEDLVIMVGISIFYFILTIYNLGASQIPSTSWESFGPSEIVLELNSSRKMSSLYALIGEGGPTRFLLYCGVPGNWSYIGSFEEDGYYQWGKVDVNRTSSYIALSFPRESGKINEIILTDDSGGMIDLSKVKLSFEGAYADNVENLVDEQDRVRLPITSFSQTYFDEIYYVRSARNYIEGIEAYEWTHPPTGKLLISFGTLIFGFNPFGWRIMGLLFSTFMIPVMYIFGKEIFGSQAAASTAGSLLFLDFMHFTMGRIATPETFAVFFNLVSCFFFYINYSKIRERREIDRSAILLGSLFFSLSFSTKWYTVFGLIGQIFLISVYYFKELEMPFKGRMKKFSLDVMPTMILSFIMSVTIYFSAYIPYILQGHNLTDIYDLQWEMYRYHSSLKESHPFSSPWWSWPFNIRPLWLTVDYLPGGLVSTVAAMGNPLIWWVGLILTIMTAKRALMNRDGTSVFITVTFLFQWIPFALMSRCLFIYHFYMNVPILILATTLFFKEYWGNSSKRGTLVVYLVAATVVFSVFYPVISGHPTSNQYSLLLRWLPSWIF
jgi:dolichyl-phosphate-mannose-protein mannosyltransferase